MHPQRISVLGFGTKSMQFARNFGSLIACTLSTSKRIDKNLRRFYLSLTSKLLPKKIKCLEVYLSPIGSPYRFLILDKSPNFVPFDISF